MGAVPALALSWLTGDLHRCQPPQKTVSGQSTGLRTQRIGLASETPSGILPAEPRNSGRFWNSSCQGAVSTSSHRRSHRVHPVSLELLLPSCAKSLGRASHPQPWGFPKFRVDCSVPQSIPIQYLMVGTQLTLENCGPLRPQEPTVLQAKSFPDLEARINSRLCSAVEDSQTVRGYMCGPR